MPSLVGVSFRAVPLSGDGQPLESTRICRFRLRWRSGPFAPRSRRKLWRRQLLAGACSGGNGGDACDPGRDGESRPGHRVHRRRVREPPRRRSSSSATHARTTSLCKRRFRVRVERLDAHGPGPASSLATSPSTCTVGNDRSSLLLADGASATSTSLCFGLLLSRHANGRPGAHRARASFVCAWSRADCSAGSRSWSR